MTFRNIKKSTKAIVLAGVSLFMFSTGYAIAGNYDQQPMVNQHNNSMMGSLSHHNNHVNPQGHTIPNSFFKKLNKYNQKLALLHFKQMNLMRDGKNKEAQELNSKIKLVQDDMNRYQRSH